MELEGQGQGHHHGSHTPTSPEVILLGKMAHHTKQIRRECMYQEKIQNLRRKILRIDLVFMVVFQELNVLLHVEY